MGREIETFRSAVEHRLEVDSVRHILGTKRRAGAITLPSVAAGQRTTLDQVTERISTIRSGERAGADLMYKHGEREQLTRRCGMRV